jgi:tetratricopeptide (TPR) repeat protein
VDLDAAARLYQEAALFAPAEAYPALIRVERARGDLQAALRAAVRLAAVRPDGRSLDLRAQVLADLGRLDESARARGGRREEAINSYRRAVALEPDNAPALAHLARLLLEAGKPEEALDHARRAVRAQPGLQAAQVNLAAAYLASGDALRAETEARRAIAAAPDSFEAHEVVAGALLALGRHAEAALSVEAALQLTRGDAARLARLGVAFEHAGLPARAREAFETALQADPLQPLALAGRGRLRLRAGDTAGAVADLSRAVQEDAEVATGWVNLAAAYLQLGRDREAEQASREELRRRPRSAQALTNLALVQQLRGDLGGALDLQERAAELAPDDPDVLANLGALEAQAGRRSEALRAYLRLLELRPNDGTCHNDVAVLYFREGQVDAARRHVSRALALGAPVSREFLAALARTAGGEPGASAR